MSNATPAPRDVPVPALGLASFVGREREISGLESLLADGTRLLTLTGPGGSGKTRLARAVVSEVERSFEDGVWWVDLAPISDPDLVSHAVASVLAVYATPGLTLAEAIAEDLRELEILIVLDNCEHLVGACAELADELLRSCAELRILATSREPLGLMIERSLFVHPLSVPRSGDESVEELRRFESVRLFVERARHGLPGFALDTHNARPIAEICRRLDGMPLAIELAAARVRVLSVEQISSRLENSFGILAGGSRTALPRHQTLRATIDWSHELLDPGERILFRRLSVFVWGFTLDAAETVCSGDGLEREAILDLLTRLVDKSLILVAEQESGWTRYRPLETVRQYGLERLEASGEAGTVRRRHAEFFVDLAERAHPELRTKNQVEWLARLEREDDNLRAALSWATAEDVEIAARLGWSLWPFWWIHTRQREGRRWLAPVLARREELSLTLQARTIMAAGVMAYGQGADETVEGGARELMRLSDAVGGDARAEAYAHAAFGLLAMSRGDFEAATEHIGEGLPLFHESDEEGMAAQSHTWLGTILLLQGDFEGAAQRFEEGLALGRRIGDRLSVCNALYNLAQLKFATGDYDIAARLYEEGVFPSQEMGDWGNVAFILEGLAAVAGAQRRDERAARLSGAAEGLTERIGLRGHTYYQPLDESIRERIMTAAHSRLGDTAWEAARAKGRVMSPEDTVEYALSADNTPASTTETGEETLSAREMEVLVLVAEGLTNPQVAERLYLSPRTVGQHLRSIYRKLGVPSRAAAAREAVDRGLI